MNLNKESGVEIRNNLVNTSLRITEDRNNYIKEKALEIGISQNAFTNVLIDIGIKIYELNLEDVLARSLQSPTK